VPEGPDILAAVRDLLEYAGYRLLGAIVPLLPRAAAVWLGRRLGGLAYWLDARARATGLENLALALPGRGDHRCILRASLRTQGVALLDALWSRRLTPEGATRYLEIGPEGEALLARALAEGKGLVVATAHFGSWEMFNLGTGARGLPRCTFIARPVRNARIDRHLRRCREATGNRLVYREGALLACLAALRKGEIVCSVVDMSVAPEEGGIFAEFFGLPALTSGALALLAHRRGAPLLFVLCHPLEGGRRYALRGRLVPVDAAAPRAEEVPRVTRELNRELEREVRAQPEAWIWTYKRWKARPWEEPSAYPSYSLWADQHV